MAVWIALAAFLVALAAGIAIRRVQGDLHLAARQAHRRQLHRRARPDRARTAAEFDEQLARASASTGQLSEAQARLSASRARLEVQLAAVREARGQLTRVFWFVPGR